MSTQIADLKELRHLAENASVGTGHYSMKDAYRAFEEAVSPEVILGLVEVVDRVNAYIDACEIGDKRAEEDTFDALHVALAEFEPRVSWSDVKKKAGLDD